MLNGSWPALATAGVSVSIVDPRRIRAFRTAEGRIAKTDPLDAGLIARFAHVMKEHLRPAPSADQIALKALSTRRRQLTELIAMEKTRLAQAVEDHILDSHKAVIKALTAALRRGGGRARSTHRRRSRAGPQA